MQVFILLINTSSFVPGNPIARNPTPRSTHSRLSKSEWVDVTIVAHSTLRSRCGGSFSSNEVSWWCLWWRRDSGARRQDAADNRPSRWHWTSVTFEVQKKQLIRNEAFSLSFVTDAVFFLPHHRFMSSSVGFRYLYHSGYIDREVDSWFYVSQRFYIQKRFMTTRRTELNLVNNRRLGSKLHVRGASWNLFSERSGISWTRY